MPRPKEQAGAAPADGAADEKDKPCGYCGKEVDHSDQYITATCNRCGTSPYHPECVTKMLTSKFEKTGSAKRATHFHFYETRPHLDFVSRVGKCPAGSYLTEEPACPGYLQVADLIRPKKAAPAPPPPQPQRAPRPKQQQQQQQQPKAAPALKPRAPQVPAPPRVIAARPAAPLAPAQPGVLRDRLGVRLPQGADQDAAAAQKKKKKPLEFPGGLRPEELTLCRQLETVGECSLPNCVFAHSEEELEQREDEYRAEQARLKKEQRRAAALEKQRSLEEAAAASAAATTGASTMADSGADAAEASGWGTASEAGAWEGDAASASEAAAGGSGGGGGSGEMWAELVARARGAVPSVPASSAASVAGSAQGEAEGDSISGGGVEGSSQVLASWQPVLQQGGAFGTAVAQTLYGSVGSSGYNPGAAGSSFEGGWHPAAVAASAAVALPAAVQHSQGEYPYAGGAPTQHGQLSNELAPPVAAVPAASAVPAGFLEGYQAGQAAIMAHLGLQQQEQQQAGWVAAEDQGHSTPAAADVDWAAVLGSAPSGNSSTAATQRGEQPGWGGVPGLSNGMAGGSDAFTGGQQAPVYGEEPLWGQTSHLWGQSNGSGALSHHQHQHQHQQQQQQQEWTQQQHPQQQHSQQEQPLELEDMLALLCST